MDQNMAIHYLAAEAEHKLTVARAEQAWKRMDHSTTRGRVGLSAGLSALVARLKATLTGRMSVPSAPAAGRQGTPSAC
jgi:hypothetical protein